MTVIILIAVVVGVAALVAAIASMFTRTSGAIAESRLGAMAQSSHSSLAEIVNDADGLIDESVDGPDRFRPLETAFARFLNLRLLIQQAGMTVAPGVIILLAIVLAVLGGVIGMLTPLYYVIAPLAVFTGGAAPIVWVLIKRHLRLSAFERQLPEAMEMLARSLRAGHSLGDGINLIGQDMPEPIASEFLQCYEQQNLGIMLEDALDDMTVRVPNLDLRFFATAISLQRQTGGDAAEVLDKIGHLIRERFGVRGQIKALTGEGRLSGLVLIALPIVLGIYMYFRNPDYLRVLVEDPIGQKMLAGAIVLQILGTIVIKKIVDIKV